MLVIKNLDKIKKIEFTVANKQWICYGMENHPSSYNIAFIPIDDTKGVYDLSKTKFVQLCRIGLTNVETNITKYRLSIDTEFEFITNRDLKNPMDLAMFCARTFLNRLC
jgi:hypothetical protein